MVSWTIVLTQSLGDIKKRFGAFIEKACLLHIICAYITYFHFDIVKGGEKLGFDLN